jgi:D-alanyl-lipoteichoic acid acyltransferase DltB (MBOAT superfamily)
MVFNSIDFAIFLPIVFLLYWFVTATNLKLQNLLIVTASYIFYGWWDYRFLSLIILSTLVDYFVGLKLKNEEKQAKRKVFLWISILINLGILGLFKYYNFFLDNFMSAFVFFGKGIKANSLNIILPVGISFYTFQTLSYTIDVYKKKLEPTTDFMAFSAFVSFFPQLVAGPIERATHLLPQFYRTRTFDYSKAVDGMRQILWGLFKRTFIVWGALNAIYFLPLLLTKKNRSNLDIVAQKKGIPSLEEFLCMILTFGLIVFAWIFFRAENIEHAVQYISNMFKNPASFFDLAIYLKYRTIISLILIFVWIEWIGREGQFAISDLGLKRNPAFRIAMYYAIIIAIFWFGGKEQQFIYFQF